MREKIVFYTHAGSGNHGCEAIVNTLCRMLNTEVTLVTNSKKEDEKYSVNGMCELIQERKFSNHKLAHVLYYIYRKITKDKESFILYRYHEVFGKKRSPLAISIGGDNYCYDMMLNDLFLANTAFNRAGTTTMLVGCSIEPELLSRKEINEDLAKYKMIIARESITYEALVAHYKNTEVPPEILCYPDPAFTLKEKRLPLPEGFLEGKTVGINISPLVMDCEGKEGIILSSYKRLIEHVIRTTDMQIALIPHVVWDRNNDRIPIEELYRTFEDTKRVIKIEDGTCEELKGYIARCRMFIGARTHATIAAYSSCVPTLVAGYSVKAKGIAKDLFGTYDNYVLPVQQLRNEEALIDAFQWMLDYEEDIRKHLQEVIPGYVKQAYKTGDEIEKIWNRVRV